MKKSILTKNQVKEYSKQIKVNGKDGRIDVTVRYDDDIFRNGYNAFSITGAIYSHPTSAADRYYVSGGCIHDEIKEYFPELAYLIKWHLMNCNEPINYIDNTLFLASWRRSQSARKTAIWEDATLE